MPNTEELSTAALSHRYQITARAYSPPPSLEPALERYQETSRWEILETDNGSRVQSIKARVLFEDDDLLGQLASHTAPEFDVTTTIGPIGLLALDALTNSLDLGEPTVIHIEDPSFNSANEIRRLRVAWWTPQAPREDISLQDAGIKGDWKPWTLDRLEAVALKYVT